MREKKKDLRVVKTYRVLYDALLELLEDNSFEEIKVSDICDKALINRSTFYSHFSDKYELLSSYIQDLKITLKEELNKNANISGTKEYYLELIRILLNHIEQKKQIYISVMVNNKNSIIVDMVYDALNEEVSNRLLQDGDIKKVPMDIVTAFYLGAISNVGMRWLANSKYTKDELLNYLDKLLPDTIYLEK